jgi:hypothetical protein
LRLQFEADARLNEVEVLHNKQTTTFKRAMNEIMKANRKVCADNLHELMRSHAYPLELWPLLAKQSLWYHHIGQTFRAYSALHPTRETQVSACLC